MHVLNSAGGGAALSTLGLIDSLRAQGIEAAAVCHDAGSDQERAQLRQATRGEVLFTPLYWWNRKIRTRLWKRPLAEIRQVVRTHWMRRSTDQVCGFAERCGCDLIHTNTILTPEGGMAARRLKLPHVWHLRELVGPGNPFRLPVEGKRLGNYLAEHCSQLIANSEASAAQIRNWLPPDLLNVVPNGIDLSRFQSRPPVSEQGNIVIAMVGSLTSRSKKHFLFIDAAAHVNRSLPIQWRIYGHDPSQGGTTRGDEYTQQIHERIHHHRLESRFNWPGFLDDPAEIMSQIHILVHPADNESFGRVVVEAMAAGLPVVGVRGGGVGEIIADAETGLLARPDDAAELGRLIERLAIDPALRQQFGEAGRRRAQLHYSLEACASGVLSVYRAAMERPLSTGARAAELARDPGNGSVGR